MKYRAKDGVCYLEIASDEAVLVFADGKFTSLTGPEVINTRIHSAFRGVGLKLATDDEFAESMISAYHDYVEHPEDSEERMTGGYVPNDGEDDFPKNGKMN